MNYARRIGRLRRQREARPRALASEISPVAARREADLLDALGDLGDMPAAYERAADPETLRLARRADDARVRVLAAVGSEPGAWRWAEAVQQLADYPRRLAEGRDMTKEAKP